MYRVILIEIEIEEIDLRVNANVHSKVFWDSCSQEYSQIFYPFKSNSENFNSLIPTSMLVKSLLSDKTLRTLSIGDSFILIYVRLFCCLFLDKREINYMHSSFQYWSFTSYIVINSKFAYFLHSFLVGTFLEATIQ